MKYRRMAQTTTTTAANRLNFIYAHFYLLSICKRAHMQLKFHSAETIFFLLQIEPIRRFHFKRLFTEKRRKKNLYARESIQKHSLA